MDDLHGGIASRQRIDHGVAIGDSLSELKLLCGDGVARTIAAAPIQLLTISATGECPSCELHLRGLDELWAAGEITIPSVIVYWSSAADAAHAEFAYRSLYRRPACRDPEATWWESREIRQTPVTLLVRAGRVIHLDDAPLVSRSEKDAFLAGLRPHIP